MKFFISLYIVCWVINQNGSGAVCAYAHGFRKRSGCALIGGYAQIRTKTVSLYETFSKFNLNDRVAGYSKYSPYIIYGSVILFYKYITSM